MRYISRVRNSNAPQMRNEHATAHPASSLLLALELMRAEGYEAAACLHGTGLSTESLKRSNKTVTLKQETVFYRNLLRLTGDPCLGVRIGQTYLPQHYGLFGYALVSATSARQALTVATEFGHHLTFTWFQMSFVTDDGVASFEFRDRLLMDSDVRAMYFDRDCAAFCIAANEVLRQPVPLKCIQLPHEGHGRRQAYEQYFGCPVSFGHDHAAIRFDKAILDVPLPFRDTEASAQLAQQCRLQLSKLTKREGLADEVRDQLMGSPGHFPGIEWVAGRLNVSARTMRRRLSEENTSYQAILDEVRFNLAQEYLLGTALPLQEIAQLVGFTEAGNFTHAFKRWAGETPLAFRKRA